MTDNGRFQPVFQQLKAILETYAGRLVVQADGPTDYSLATPRVAALNKAMFFGAAQIKKNYVSYHLMPVYVHPEMLDGVSPGLKKRMQGKSCFNFTRLDPATVDELRRLTAEGFAAFERDYLREKG